MTGHTTPVSHSTPQTGAVSGNGSESGTDKSEAQTTLRSTSKPKRWKTWFDWFLRLLFQRVLDSRGSPPVTVELADGQMVYSAAKPPVARIIVRDRTKLLRLIADPMYEFGELYTSGDLEVVGDLIELFTCMNTSMQESHRGKSPRGLLSAIRHRRGRSTMSAARKNIHRHYDIGNDFYKIWLDDQLIYTCAYFPDREMSLEEAQVAKLDHVCRKLQLRPDETVVEAGCGWGALALHMAEHYGVRVKAYNISHEQIAFARERALQKQLQSRVEFIEDDWRCINDAADAFVSVGMLEHVGPENYKRLGEIIKRCIGGTGRGLIHTIGMNRPRPLDPWTEERIFPGAQPPSLGQMCDIFEPGNLSIIDVENLRLHYALTLRHWLERFEASADSVRRMFDERFVKLWRLYLSSSVTAFETGWLQLFQVVFAPGTSNRVPWTRAFQYESQHATLSDIGTETVSNRNVTGETV